MGLFPGSACVGLLFTVFVLFDLLGVDDDWFWCSVGDSVDCLLGGGFLLGCWVWVCLFGMFGFVPV